MKFVVAITLLCVYSLLWLAVESSREVTCSFGPERNDDINERLLTGSPGKRGATGLKGVKGQPGVKGERGQTDESREELEAMRTKLKTMENLMEENIRIREEHSAEIEKLKEIAKKLRGRDCDDIAREGFLEDGIYQILLNGKITDIYCELSTSTGNWIVFQKRYSGEVDFYLDWNAYKSGFGNMSGEFWLGLDKMHSITSTGSYKLRVDLEDWDGNTAYAEYSSFSIGDSSTNYRLNVGGYSGTADDSLAYHNNRPFTTKDRDHHVSSGNCAVRYHGAWWYKRCHHSNLNGLYVIGGESNHERGIIWKHWKGSHYSVKKTSMKLQRVP